MIFFYKKLTEWMCVSGQTWYLASRIPFELFRVFSGLFRPQIFQWCFIFLQRRRVLEPQNRDSFPSSFYYLRNDDPWHWFLFVGCIATAKDQAIVAYVAEHLSGYLHPITKTNHLITETVSSNLEIVHFSSWRVWVLSTKKSHWRLRICS